MKDRRSFNSIPLPNAWTMNLRTSKALICLNKKHFVSLKKIIFCYLIIIISCKSRSMDCVLEMVAEWLLALTKESYRSAPFWSILLQLMSPCRSPRLLLLL